MYAPTLQVVQGGGVVLEYAHDACIRDSDKVKQCRASHMHIHGVGSLSSVPRLDAASDRHRRQDRS